MCYTVSILAKAVYNTFSAHIWHHKDTFFYPEFTYFAS